MLIELTALTVSTSNVDVSSGAQGDQVSRRRRRTTMEYAGVTLTLISPVQ